METYSEKLKMIRKVIEVAEYFEKDASDTIEDIKFVLEVENEKNSFYEGVSNIIVDSSWIDEFSYDVDKRTLNMKTLSGKEYQYYDVPVGVWYDLCQVNEDGGSVGSFYNENIKGQYDLNHTGQYDSE